MLYWADVETNECLTNNGGCWQDKAANITACKVFICIKQLANKRAMWGYSLFSNICVSAQDTFRGRVCECPLVDGV